nr:hypothetical protein [Tanacetum cinerariifolium]
MGCWGVEWYCSGGVECTGEVYGEEELGAEQVQVDAAVVEDVVEDVAEDVAHGEAFPATFQQVLDTCSALLRCVKHLEHDNVAQRLEIVKLKVKLKKLEQTDKVKSSKLRRLKKVRASRQVESSDDIEDVFNQERMNEDEGIELEVVEVVTTAKLITKVVTAAASQVSAASTTIPAASATIPAAKPTISAAAPTVVAAYTRRRKGVIIRDLEEELSLKTSKTPTKTPKVKDKGKGKMVETLKPMKKKDQIEMDAEYARKLQEEIDRDHDRFNKDVDWDAAMDHVNQKSSKATPLASKVPVVDYQIMLIDNKPRWTRCYIEKSKECSWFGIGEKMEAADFMWCSYHYSFKTSAIPIG